jgi:hypothetical protein
MKETRYITTTVQAGNRLEIDLPNSPVGQTIEVILIIPDSSPVNPGVIAEFGKNCTLRLKVVL